eukprot:579216-Rhodomonas_salina.1
MPDGSRCTAAQGLAPILYNDDRFFGGADKCVEMKLWNKCISPKYVLCATCDAVSYTHLRAHETEADL